MKSKSFFTATSLMCLGFLSFTNMVDYKPVDNETIIKTYLQEAPTLPVGTIISLITTKDIYAKNFKSGDHFFVELARDITSKGKVLIPAGTLVQIDVFRIKEQKAKS